jgi:hypothetical protein
MLLDGDSGEDLAAGRADHELIAVPMGHASRPCPVGWGVAIATVRETLARALCDHPRRPGFKSPANRIALPIRSWRPMAARTGAEWTTKRL